MPLGNKLLTDLQFHQRLRHDAHALPQDVDIVARLGLAPQPFQCHPDILDHGRVPSLGSVRQLLENHDLAVSVNDSKSLTHALGL